MNNTTKKLLLNYSIPGLMLIVIIVQFVLVNTKNLSPWKGGGYGMYTEIHYSHNQIHIQGMSTDSLMKDENIKDAIKHLQLIPNKNNLKETAELVMKKTKQDSIQMQIWRPIIDSESRIYTRVLLDEIKVKKSIR